MKLKNLLGEEGMDLILANLEEEDQENNSIDPVQRIIEKAISKGFPIKQENKESGETGYLFRFGDFSKQQRKEIIPYGKALIAYLGISHLKVNKPESYHEFKSGILQDRGEVEIDFNQIGKKMPAVGLAYKIFKLYSFYKKMGGKPILS
jgi:hypothetical protein